MIRQLLHRYVPAQFHDPVGLARRLVASGDPAARFAMRAAAGALALAPLDLALSLVERRRWARAEPPRGPLIFVCGAPRSGTTLVAQALIRALPVSYFNNFTSLFPRAPITADRLLGRLIRRRPVTFHSYYGRTAHLSGPNDALYFWDRWLGRDRDRPPDTIAPAAAEAMRAFFGAWEAHTGRPLVNKCNALVASAHLVAEVLPTARFVCLVRDPVPHVLSLERARREIHGDPRVRYGLGPPAGSQPADDPLVDLCRQAVFHQRLARHQERRLGPSRFRVISYEAFCRDPDAVVRLIGREELGLPDDRIGRTREVFRASTASDLPAEQRQRIEAELARAGADQPD